MDKNASVDLICSLGPWSPALAPFIECCVHFIPVTFSSLVRCQLHRLNFHRSWFVLQNCTWWQKICLTCMCVSSCMFSVASGLMVPVYLSGAFSASACLELPLKLKNGGMSLMSPYPHLCLAAEHTMGWFLVLRICVFILTWRSDFQKCESGGASVWHGLRQWVCWAWMCEAAAWQGG